MGGGGFIKGQDIIQGENATIDAGRTLRRRRVGGISKRRGGQGKDYECKSPRKKMFSGGELT